jgi:hypothetical protein
MDPNGQMNTGTGYLRSIAPQIPVINDRSEWRKIHGRFDAIITNATIHHWQHIPTAALDLRRMLRPGGVGLRFTNSLFPGHPTYLGTRAHLFTSKYRTYEWPYPSTAYIDMICSVGFDLIGAANKFRPVCSASRYLPRA